MKRLIENLTEQLQKEIILKHLNELGKDLEKSYGNKLILLDEKDFEKFAEKLVKKLTLTDVVSCVCKIPEPRLKVSENGTHAYCNNCAKTYWQK